MRYRINTTVILLFFLIIGNIEAQTIAIENRWSNIAYPGMDNQLTVVVEGVALKDISIETDNGRVENTGTPGFFRFIPERIGEAHLTIYKWENQQAIKIGIKAYRVKRWPTPEAQLSARSSGDTISVGEFRAQEGVSVPISGFDICGYHKALSYRMQIIQDYELLFEASNKGARFSDLIMTGMKEASSGDKIIIDQIKVNMPGEKIPRVLAPLIIYLK